jgi:hypothetical protein
MAKAMNTSVATTYTGAGQVSISQKSGIPITATVTVPDAGKCPSGPIDPISSRPRSHGLCTVFTSVIVARLPRDGKPQKTVSQLGDSLLV